MPNAPAGDASDRSSADVRDLTEQELDLAIDDMKRRIENQVNVRNRLLAELQALRGRLSAVREQEAQQEIARLRKEIDNL